MKKLLTGLIVTLSTFVLLLGLAQPVFATTEDDYYDLFYEEITVTFEILTETSGSGEITDGTFEQLLQFVHYDINSSPTNILSIKFNDTLLTDGIGFTFGESWGMISGYVGESFYWIDLQSNDTYSVSEQYEAVVGDEWAVTFRVTKPWTEMYTFGRLRTSDNFDLQYSSSTQTVSVFNRIESGQLKIDASSLTYDGVYSDPIVIQSPYKEFKVLTYEYDNVAAVWIRFIKAGSDYRADFKIYYWDGNEIAVATRNEVIHSDSGGFGNPFEFFGGVRTAISTQENFVANVDNLVPLESFIDYIVAWDDIYGDISDQVYIEYDGGYEPDVVGVYDVIFAVEDAEGNESTLEAKVHVVDIVAPVITGTTTPVNISYNQDFNVSAWVASLTVTDNYYTGLTISIQSNTYSSNKTALGTYEVVVKATDPSGNTGTLSRTINVVDGVGPVFSGISTVTASISEHLTVDQIKAALSATDAKDGNVTASITIDSDELTGNAETPGTYEIIFMAEDSAGNQTFKTVTVTIISAPPGFYLVDGSSIRLLPGSNLTISQILDVLDVTEELTEDLTTNYQMGIPGVYNLSFKYDNTLYQLTVTVLGVDDPVLPPPPLVQDPINYTAIIGGVAIAVLGIIAIVYFVKRKKSA